MMTPEEQRKEIEAVSERIDTARARSWNKFAATMAGYNEIPDFAKEGAKNIYERGYLDGAECMSLLIAESLLKRELEMLTGKITSVEKENPKAPAPKITNNPNDLNSVWKN